MADPIGSYWAMKSHRAKVEEIKRQAQRIAELEAENKRLIADYDHRTDQLNNEVRACEELRKRIVELELANERSESALGRIADWALKAYHRDFFVPQDFAKADAVLKEHGVNMTAMHFEVGNHMLAGIGKIAREALGDKYNTEGWT